MKRLLTASAIALSLTFTAPAFASGGGGGGGGSLQSSGPSYDPVEEYQKGIAAIKAEDFKTAERALKKVVKVARKDANSHYLLGIAHYGQDEFGPAAKSFGKAVKYDATNYDAHAYLVIAHTKKGKANKAAAALTDLNAAKASCESACEKIDAALAKVAAGTAASAEGEDVSALPPRFQQASLNTGDLAYSDALRLINLQRYDAGIAELERAQSAVGPHPDVLTYLGFANRKLGNKDAALSYYTAALSIDPNHLNANEYLGEYYVELGDLERANAQLMKLEALCPFGCAQIEELKVWMAETDA